MKPELESIVDTVTSTLGISAHAKGTIMEVELNWAQLDALFDSIFESLSVRYRSLMGVITVEQWRTVCRALCAKRIQFVRETVYGRRDEGYPIVRLPKVFRMHGVLHTVFAQIGLFKSEDIGIRFIPAHPPKEWTNTDREAFVIHADLIEALRNRGVVTSEGFPTEATGSMAYLLLVKDIEEGVVLASAPTKEANPNDGMMASVIFQTRNALTLAYAYDFSTVAQPSYVMRRLIGAYMGGKNDAED